MGIAGDYFRPSSTETSLDLFDSTEGCVFLRCDFGSGSLTDIRDDGGQNAVSSATPAEQEQFSKINARSRSPFAWRSRSNAHCQLAVFIVEECVRRRRDLHPSRRADGTVPFGRHDRVSGNRFGAGPWCYRSCRAIRESARNCGHCENRQRVAGCRRNYDYCENPCRIAESRWNSAWAGWKCSHWK